MSISGWIYILLCALSAVIANFLFRYTIQGQESFQGSILDYVHLFFRPLFITGLLFYGLAMIAWVKVLSSEPLNLAYPVLVSITFALVVITATILFKEPFGTYKIVGVLFLLIGISLMAQN